MTTWRAVRSAPALLLGLLLWPSEVAADGAAERYPTTTPIKYLVVLYPENSSFDRYFGSYPVAANPEGSPPFTPGPARLRSTA